MVAQTRHAAAPSPKGRLDFRDKLVGKALTTDALLKKLKNLHTQLAALDQDHVDVPSLATAKKELIHSSILLHKDRGVKAYAACCLADLLRLYAPDAPYTQPELRDIFQFFFRQLANGLKGADATYYNEYFHLLESLSTVKSVVLVCDLPSADELMVEIFRDFFSLVKRDISKKVELFMADILVALIDEAQALPSEVMDTILSQFADKNARIDQPAFRLAVQICNATADKLQRNVCQYFSDIISSHAEDEDYEEIRVAHDLIKILHRSCPGVLHSVIPLLDEELRADDVTIRTMATQVLGEMFADKAGGDLLKKYPATWTSWCGRKTDKSVPIRLKLVESCKSLIVNRTEGREAVEAMLKEKVLDPDEKVRAAVCKVYSQLDYESALHHVSQEQIQAIAGRGLDKKAAVRFEALNAVGKLYSLAYPEIENNDASAISQFAWIPEEILKITSTSTEIRNVVEQVIAEHILPLPSSASGSKGSDIDEVAWTDRLLCVMRYLSEKSIKSLLGLTGLKAIRPNIYQIYIESCIDYNGGIMDENEEVITRRLNAAIQHLAVIFPDPHKAQEDLHAFAKLNENRLFKLSKTCMDPQTDLKSLVKATSEFTRRLTDSASALLPTLTIFLRRTSFRILNTSSVPSLLKRVAKGTGGSTAGHLVQTAGNAQTLLNFASKYCAGLYKGHVQELVKCLAEERNGVLVEVALQALSGLGKVDDSEGGGGGGDRKTVERVEGFVRGGSWRLAKFGMRYLAFARGAKEVCKRIADGIAEEFSSGEEMEDKDVAARMAALSQLIKFQPKIFESHSGVFTTFLLKKVLMAPITPEAAEHDEDMDDGEEWFENEDVPDALRARILALKVCRTRCLVHADSDKALDIAKPVLKMYATLLEHNGSLTPTSTQQQHENEQHQENPKYLSRLRLQAAVSLLKLATVEQYAGAVAQKFLRLALVVQDSCYNVRFEFLTKLLGVVQPRRVPAMYNVIPFLTVHDPEADIRSIAAAYIENAKKRLTPALRVEYLELIFIRLLHLLAHHPDFSTTHDDLLDIAKYLQLYLDLIATQDNISLLQHLALKAKTVRDAESHSENLYIMAELAQELIKKRASDRSWTIQTYPGKVRLPPDILRPLPSSEAGKEILKTAYLPEETREWLEEMSKTALPKEKKERKRKAPSTKSEGTKRRRKRAKAEEDDEDEDGAGVSSDVENEEEGGMDVDEEDARTSSPKQATPRPRGTRVSARNKAKAKPKRGTSPLTEQDDEEQEE
ncbi:cohesin-associated protein Pds5 [Ephemerocybe angulata]|uniref:Cohesin-associated protein Pds5 n=1 Tax=Ephemerocybe angulata TaxID=980116 RepID=A0A8H6I5I2_9AGAR|nr:cohesin-associated protein Pds5 [Tulosesus angulatus]